MRQPCSLTALADRPPAVLRDRGGFSLVELIVALLMLTVGLGALAGTGAWVLRETAASRRLERAATLARGRLELLRASPCTNTSGARAHGDLVEQWTLSVDGRRAVADVSIVARDSGLMPGLRQQAAFGC